MAEDYLSSVKKQFAYYKGLGEKTFAQLSEEQLFWQYNSESNSITIIVKHLWGKMCCDTNWTSLSIPKGNSVQFNAEKFSRGKRKAHFTDEA